MKRSGPGRVRCKLAKMITKQLTEAGMFIKPIDPEKLIPNQGYWRIDWRADCMPWTGSFDISHSNGDGWVRNNIESWDTMTALIRGFTFEKTNGWTIELYAIHEIPHPKNS